MRPNTLMTASGVRSTRLWRASLSEWGQVSILLVWCGWRVEYRLASAAMGLTERCVPDKLARFGLVECPAAFGFQAVVVCAYRAAVGGGGRAVVLVFPGVVVFGFAGRSPTTRADAGAVALLDVSP